MRRLLIAVGIVVFLAISFLVARWLNTDSVERGAVVVLLRAQARGDVRGMLRELTCRDAACLAAVRDDARRLRTPGELNIVFYESGTAHALTSRTKSTRVVWNTRERPGQTTVQCVLVQRKGSAVAGVSVSLLRISTPIGRESSCP